MSIFKDQADFMVAGKQTIKPGSRPQIRLYAKLIEEESDEFLLEDSLDANKPVTANTIKECVDTIVVCAGYLISALGEDGAQKAWNLVHEGNLSKVSGSVEHREDGKILKSEEYKKQAKLKVMAGLEALLLEVGN
jgi:hypothetical protein